MKDNNLKTWDKLKEWLKKNKQLIFFIITIIVIINIWWLSGYLISRYIIKPEEEGQFGDMFGAVNALFSGLAFAGLIYTILLQRKELKLQRKELKKTRQEFDIQNTTLKKQRFENTFFQMLNLHNELINNLYFNNGVQKHEKRAVLKFINDVLIGQLKQDIKNQFEEIERIAARTRRETDITFEMQKSMLRNSLENHIDAYSDYLGHYLNNLYHLIKLIYQTDLITETEKQFYIDIIKAQLAPYELLLVFYFSLVPSKHYHSIIPLIKDFNFYEFLHDHKLAHGNHWDMRKEPHNRL